MQGLMKPGFKHVITLKVTKGLSSGAVDFDMDYVGLDLEYIVGPQRRIHFSIQTLIGTGRAQYWEGNDTVHS